MAQVVVVYDGSEPSKSGLEHALKLMREDDEIVLVSVVPPAAIEELNDVDPNLTVAKYRDAVNEAISYLHGKGISALGIVREGDTAEETVKIASELKAELIVVAERGLTKVGKFSLGSIADKILQKSDRPVLVVR